VNPVAPGPGEVSTYVPGIGAVGVTLKWLCESPAFAPLICECCGKVKVNQIECSDRTCEPCGVHRATMFRARWDHAMCLFKRGGIFITLTIKNIYGRLRHHVKTLRAKWKKLLRTKSLRSIRGGWYSIEITKGESLGANLHLHVLAWGTNGIPLRAVHRAWSKVGGGIWIHATRVRSPRHASIYLSKEISKGLLGIDPGSDLHSDIAAGLAGVRLLQSFGDLGVPVEFIPPPCSCGGAWSYLKSVDHLPMALQLEIWEPPDGANP